jgi:hypothetical protein
MDATHKAALLREKRKAALDTLSEMLEEVKNDKLDMAIELINDMLPIVEAAYNDEHTAGMIPGSGYNHKAEHLAGQKWGWQNTKKFDIWHNKVKQLTKG